MIQIWGTRKCRETQKAQRFFKERRIPFQFIDLAVKGPSAGEIEALRRALGRVPIDRDGKEYAKRVPDGVHAEPAKVLQEYPLTAQTPIVRNGKQATVGYLPEVWKRWQEEQA